MAASPDREALAVFRVATAADILSLQAWERHQDVRNRLAWTAPDAPPLLLLFISHRWETPQHPDSTGRQLRGLQTFLRALLTAVEAMLVPTEERLRLIPSLDAEGALQAVEIARRLLGQGPFTDRPALEISAELARRTRPDFRAWLQARIGVWLDYVCMPQRPLSPEDQVLFDRSLRDLDQLVAASTLVALRQAGDDYPQRGWCASEFFLGSRGGDQGQLSFARALFVDIDRLERGETVAPVGVATSGDAPSARVMSESHDQDARAFAEACAAWRNAPGPLAAGWSPGAWSDYRSLQGSGFFASQDDPNPFRRILEAVRAVEVRLIAGWLMSHRPRVIDLLAEVVSAVERYGLSCSDPRDLAYVALLSMVRGWLEPVRPLLVEGLRRYIDGGRVPSAPMPVRLEPLPDEVRARFASARPNSADTWRSRLTSGGTGQAERALVEELRAGLARSPPRFTFLAAAAPVEPL